MVTAEIAAEDRFVVSDTVPKDVELSQGVVDAPTRLRLKVWESVPKVRSPEVAFVLFR